jgi:hypothetical protein
VLKRKVTPHQRNNLLVSEPVHSHVERARKASSLLNIGRQPRRPDPLLGDRQIEAELPLEKLKSMKQKHYWPLLSMGLKI